jgi:hypothetical protein
LGTRRGRVTKPHVNLQWDADLPEPSLDPQPDHATKSTGRGPHLPEFRGDGLKVVVDLSS